MGKKTWSADIEGNLILVTNYFSLFKWQTWESLEVNGKLIQRNEGSILRLSSYMASTIKTPLGESALEILIGRKGFGAGCHILVDGELASGDIDTNLNVPTPQEWKEIKAKGLTRFLLHRGVIMMGLPYAIIMTLVVSTNLDLAGKITSFIFYLVFFGVSMGYFQWWSLAKQYDA